MKSEVKQLTIENYTYDLPEHRIARYPLHKRDRSKLLISNKSIISEDVFHHIGSHLPAGALLVSNETKVIQARITFVKSSGATIELFCLEPATEMAELQIAFSKSSPVVWKCMVGNSKRWKSGLLQQEVVMGAETFVFAARRIDKKQDHSLIEFSWNPPEVSFAEILNVIGEVPLPPYLNRKPEASDKENYQTVFAKYEGSVAAPTAGLHFTEILLQKLSTEGFDFAQLTLHVGAGTFKPVLSATMGEHQMHDEKIIVSRAFIHQLMSKLNHPIIAVGTTSMRTLESLYWIGCMLEKDQKSGTLHINQWYPYEEEPKHPVSARHSLQVIYNYLETNKLESLTASTALIIAPGYDFRIVSGLITNFHQPKSTLLLLVAALIGDSWKATYQYALENDFRFLSYGDACLFLP